MSRKPSALSYVGSERWVSLGNGYSMVEVRSGLEIGDIRVRHIRPRVRSSDPDYAAKVAALKEARELCSDVLAGIDH